MKTKNHTPLSIPSSVWMRRRHGKALTCALTAACCSAGLALSPALQAATVPDGYEVATWRGFRTSAISYTLDDSTPKQFTVGLPIFNEAGIKVTLFSVTTGGLFAGCPKLQAAAADGHEISSHCVNHRSLNTLSDDDQHMELRDSQAMIRENVPGQASLTIAYPNCAEPKMDIVSQYYIAGRTCSQQIIPKSPANFHRLSSIICGSNGMVNSFESFQSTSTNALNQGGWAVYLIHGIDADGGWSPITSTILQESVDYFSENADLFWVDTFGNVVRYIKQRDAVTITELSSSADSIVLGITDGLDDSIYTMPLTIRRPLPSGWTAAQVNQNGLHSFAKLETIDATTYVVFEAVPDAGDVTLSASEGPEKWLGVWEIGPYGWADAEGWLGPVYPMGDGYAWGEALGWLWVPESLFGESGGWAYIFR